jgi:putative tryptophan/tyrosine transport system substrate-binding protein
VENDFDLKSTPQLFGFLIAETDTRMKARIILSAFALVFWAITHIADAQQAKKKIPRVGILSSTSPSSVTWEAFREGLRELGYIEGKNLAIEYRSVQGNADRLPDLAAELVQLKVDIIVANGLAQVRAAKNATQTIPIVMLVSTDPVRDGLISSLARPGGNITGLATQPELTGKRLELLKEVFPRISRVAVFWSVGRSNQSMREAEISAQSLGLRLQPVELGGPDTIEPAFAALRQERADAFTHLAQGFIAVHRTQIVEMAIKTRLPAMYTNSLWVEAGGLMAYAPSLEETYHRVATHVDKILKGTKATDLPVERPKKFELIINLKTAKQIGVTVAPTVLARADKVIK